MAVKLKKTSLSDWFSSVSVPLPLSRLNSRTTPFSTGRPFAPNKGATDASSYVYFQFDIEGKLKNKVEFKSPASALLLTAAYENSGNVYFFGTSSKSKDPFEEVFKEYASIYNPGANEEGNNLKDIKWRKSLDEKMENFHLLKLRFIWVNIL